MEDRLLLWRMRSGNPEALRRVYEKYGRDMYSLAAALVRDKTIAEDIVHDVFVSLAQSSPRCGPTTNLKAYLMTAAANRARDAIRVRCRQPDSLDDKDPAISCDVLAEMIRDEQLRRLMGALTELPYDQRETLLLREYNGLSFRAIAACQRVSINTVQSRYRYGLEKLRSIMNGEVST